MDKHQITHSTNKLKSILPSECNISWVTSGTWDKKRSATVQIRDPNVCVINGTNQSNLKTVEIDPESWVDITFSWNTLNKEVSVSINGEEPAIIKDMSEPESMTIWMEMGTEKEPSILQIQSVLGKK